MRSRGTAARVRVTLLTGAVLAVVAGCTEEPAPGPATSQGPVSVSPSPERTPTPTATPAPETLPPERPAAMDEESVEGAEAAARYFLKLYPYVYATGDLEEWQALSGDECIFCASVVDRVTERVNLGHQTRGGTIAILDLHGEAVDDLVHVTGRVRQDALEIVDAQGAVVREEPPFEYEVSVVVATDVDRHVIRGVDVEATA